jgi:hypothetical protein
MQPAPKQTNEVFEVLKRGTLEALEIRHKRYATPRQAFTQRCDCGVAITDEQAEKQQAQCDHCAALHYE